MDFAKTRVWGPVPRYPKAEEQNAGFLEKPIIIAGPCAIESEQLVAQIAKELCGQHITYMRGGVFRAGTYPPKEFGFREDLLAMWAGIARQYNLNIIVECLDVRNLDRICKYADAIQVGARAMQNYALLKEVRTTGRPVFIKRHPGCTLDEFLGAAEYLCGYDCYPHLIERGSSTHMNHVRWELSCSMIAAIKRLTNMPVIVDASHGCGRADLVESLTLAGVAAGADGFLVEVHPTPEQSLSDAAQAFPLDKFKGLKDKALAVRRAITGE